MALIRIIGEESEAFRQRLGTCAEQHDFQFDDGDADLRIYHLRRWQPSWCPSVAAGSVLLLSPREPADPAAAFVAGIDAWLPSDCTDKVLCSQVQAMLNRINPLDD